MNLCETCANRGHCPEVGSGVLLCVEYQPMNRSACRAIQRWHASQAGVEHWSELCRLIMVEQVMDGARTVAEIETVKESLTVAADNGKVPASC